MRGGLLPGPRAAAGLIALQYPETVEYLYALGNEIKTAKLGLERVEALARKLGHPERSYDVVHVAGTNGKGSTCALIAAALGPEGTGLYTSPHLIEPAERIVINGQQVTRGAFVDAFGQVHRAAEEMIAAGDLESHPTYFETVTLMAFVLFREAGVRTAVVEVGLGGRLDATNIVVPKLCVITPIDYDHEAWLGKSLTSIATEKAGILKPGVPAVIAPQHDEVLAVLKATGGELHFVSDTKVSGLSINAQGSRFNGLVCPLAGRHQVDNTRTAALACRLLGISTAGFANARWPGRLERMPGAREVILDGAHNPSGARALAAYIREFHTGRKIALIFGAMRDKSVEEIAGVLFPLADELILTAPNQPRALRPAAMLEMEPHSNARSARGVRDALALPVEADVTFVTGSLYLVGEARALLVQ